VDQYTLGWSSEWDHYLNTCSLEAIVRITARHKNQYRALTANGQQLNCHLSGKLLHQSMLDSDLPAVGDWCVVGELHADASNERAATIHQVLPRRSKLSRKMAGATSDEQVLAANIDYVFVVTSVNHDFNINRLQRYVLLATYGRTKPLIVLSKIDVLNSPVTPYVDQLSCAFPGVPCIVTSSVSLSGLDDIRQLLAAGKTAVFVGSSGVGKSTLVNALLGGGVQKTAALRENIEKGRHTTSSSGLFFTPAGGMIIDTPGLREVQVLADDQGLAAAYPTVGELALDCKFRDCSHAAEPGCAVLSAAADGELPASDFAAYTKLVRETAYNNRKVDQRLYNEERRRWKRITIDYRRRKNSEGR